MPPKWCSITKPPKVNVPVVKQVSAGQRGQWEVVLTTVSPSNLTGRAVPKEVPNPLLGTDGAGSETTVRKTLFITRAVAVAVPCVTAPVRKSQLYETVVRMGLEFTRV